VFSQGDDAFVGWLLTATSLGFYQVAYQLASAPATEITQVISNVMLSLYSKLQDDLEELRQAFLRTMRLVTLVSAPMGVGILTVAPEFVVGVMGEQWTPMITTMQILAIFGLVRAFGATYGPVFMAVGRPDITTKLLSLNIVLLAIFIYPAAVAHGIEGVAMATLGALVIKVLVGGYVMSRVLETGVLKVFSPLLYPVIASSVMGALVVSTGAWFPLQSAVLEFVVLVAVGGASYVASVLLIDRLFKWGITSEVVTVFRSATG
jgi:PST family polysaccharide transporter/lipopolysaccharide exporter